MRADVLSNDRLRGPAALLVLLAATVIAYYPSLTGTPLWDDDAHLTRPDLRSWSGLVRIWTEKHTTQQYYPVVHSAFWIEHRLWGDAPLGYHLANVAFHAGSALLLWLLLSRLGMRGALLAAIVFALHPVMVESVAWMSEQKNTLSLLLYLAATLYWLKYQELRKKSVYAIATVLFAMALLTKSVAGTLPAALLVIQWWRNGRVSKRDVVPLLPWFAMSALMALVTITVERELGAAGAEWHMTAAQRVLLAGRAPWFYLGKLLWPSGLVFMYPRWELDPAEWLQWLYPLTTVVAAGLAFALRGRTRGPLATVLLYLGTLLPALGLVNVYPFRYSYVADHFQYHASIYVIAALAAAAALATRRLPVAVNAAAAIALGVLLGILTWKTAAPYRNAETHYRSIVERNPASWFAHNNLGLLMLDRGDVHNAISSFETAHRLNPEAGEIMVNLAGAYQATGRPSDALRLYERGLPKTAPDASAEHAFGVLLQSAGRTLEASRHLERAVELAPGNVAARLDLATALAKLGQWGRVQEESRAVLDIDRDNLRAKQLLGDALVRNGAAGDAIAVLSAAIEQSRDNPDLHLSLGNAYAATGRFPEAIRHFERALALRPDGFTEAQLAVALDDTGQHARALAHFESALRRAPGSADVHHRAGVAWLRRGQLPRGIRHLEQAVRLAPNDADMRVSLAIALLNAREPDRAAEQARIALRLQPDHAGAQRVLQVVQQ